MSCPGRQKANWITQDANPSTQEPNSSTQDANRSAQEASRSTQITSSGRREASRSTQHVNLGTQQASPRGQTTGGRGLACFGPVRAATSGHALPTHALTCALIRGAATFTLPRMGTLYYGDNLDILRQIGRASCRERV